MRELVGPHAGRVPRAALLRVPRQGSPRAAPSAGDEAGRDGSVVGEVASGALDDAKRGGVRLERRRRPVPADGARGIAEEAPKAARGGAAARTRAKSRAYVVSRPRGGSEEGSGAEARERLAASATVSVTIARRGIAPRGAGASNAPTEALEVEYAEWRATDLGVTRCVVSNRGAWSRSSSQLP